MEAKGRNPWQARQRSNWREWQAAKREAVPLLRRPARRRRGVMDTPWVAVAAFLALGGVYLLLNPDALPPLRESATSGRSVFTICGEVSSPNCVVDGDTLRYGGERIRLADINAPEVFSPQCDQEAWLGRRATRRLQELVNAGPFEIASSGLRDEDRYGRKLRLLKRDGRSLGDILVFEGLAHPWRGHKEDWCA